MIERFETGSTMSRVVLRDGLLYFSGHVAGGQQPTIKEQTTALLARYDELFEQYGTDKSRLVSATIYIADMNLKAEMNEVWDAWMPAGCAPVRVCVEVGLPEGYLLEVSVIAEQK
ncbi:RidA family protein [Ruminococcaceae bacterium OttesenSCG-928-O06]|nr:RidA family protein [Ruminococcaceae bacterium OttesenSCG-928-O06]